MKILVTGAAGFIGYALAEVLSRDEGNLVYCVDNFVRGADDSYYKDLCSRKNVVRIDFDLNNPNYSGVLPDEVDYIYHMAALNGTQNFYERPLEVVRCCTLPTLNLLSYYLGEGKLTGRFIHAGTCESYAPSVNHGLAPVPTPEDVLLSVDDPGNLRWSYGGSKINNEIALYAAAQEALANGRAFEFSILRYHNVYGPRMGDKHVIPDYLHRVFMKNESALYGAVNTRSFMYIHDCVRATIKCATEPSLTNEIVNIGINDMIPMTELVKKMLPHVNTWRGYRYLEPVGEEIVCHEAPKGSVVLRAPDVTKLTEIGFEPLVSLDEGLEKTVHWYFNDWEANSASDA